MYIPQSCLSGTYLAVSTNEGASYTWLSVAAAPSTNGLGATVQLAIDSADNLYVLWLGSSGLNVVVSRDGGHHWGAPTTISPPGLRNIILPALAALAGGHIGIVYYASTAPSANTLSGYVSQTNDALAQRPLFYVGEANNPAHPIFRNYGDAYSPRADFIGAAYDSGGGFWGALVEQLGPPDASNQIATSGYVTRLVPATVLPRRRAPQNFVLRNRRRHRKKR